jgi:hypothetical protein
MKIIQSDKNMCLGYPLPTISLLSLLLFALQVGKANSSNELQATDAMLSYPKVIGLTILNPKFNTN